MRKSAGRELPGSHLKFAPQGAGIAGQQVMQIVTQDRLTPPAGKRHGKLAPSPLFQPAQQHVPGIAAGAPARRRDGRDQPIVGET
jgi:hypothetical protein